MIAPPAQEHDALPPGTRFGELEVLRVLGVGGFGIVYLALDHSLEREVALKEYMPASLAARGQGSLITVRSSAHAETYAMGLRSFVNEARLLAKFDHPSMVKVYRFWEDNGTAYMVMPFLQGRTLRDARRAMTTPPDEAWIRSVLDPVLSAVELLHKEGVYHRDIAPDNILLPPEGAPILLDFGAARRVISDRTQSLTAILKPSYAPIEQYAEMASLRQGPWTDIYAIGAVIHFLLFGAPPPPATARAVQDDMAESLAGKAPPGVSARMISVLAWTLGVKPIDRPQSIDMLRGALDGRVAPPVAATPPARDQVTIPSATALMPVSPAYEPTVRVEGSYSEPTEVLRRAPPTAPAPAPRAPRAEAPRPSPPPAAAAPAKSNAGAIVGGITVVLLLLAGGSWWFTRGGSPPAVPLAAAPAVVEPAAPAVVATPVVAAPPPAVAAAPAVVPAPVVAAPAMVASEPAAAVVAVPAPPVTRPAVVAPVVAAAPPPKRPAAQADSGALQPRPAGTARPGETTEPQRAQPVEAAPPPQRTAAAAPVPAPAPVTQPAAATPVGNATQVCGSRVFLALELCMNRECKKPEFAEQADCRKHVEAVRKRDAKALNPLQ